MNYLEQKLLAEARDRANKAHKKVVVLRSLLDDAKVEYEELDRAATTLEGLAKEHDDFSGSANDVLGE